MSGGFVLKNVRGPFPLNDVARAKMQAMFRDHPERAAKVYAAALEASDRAKNGLESRS